MSVQVLVEEFAMAVHVAVDQVCGDQEVQIVHHRCTGGICLNSVILANNNRPVADLLDNIQVMGGGNNGFTGFGKILNQFDKPYLAPGIETSRRFIKQQDIRIRG
jgi:hypothetical protein